MVSNNDLEDEMHMFLHCKFVGDCWKEANLLGKIEPYMTSSGCFSSLIFAILRVFEVDISPAGDNFEFTFASMEDIRIVWAKGTRSQYKAGCSSIVSVD